MSYSAYETNIYTGTPVEVYRFVYGDNYYHYTSYASAYAYGGNTYDPIAMTRSSLKSNSEAASDSLDITVPRDNPIVVNFIAYAPQKITVTVYRVHSADSAQEGRVLFKGFVSACTFSGSEATLTCLALAQAFRKTIPSYFCQTNCNHVLYGDGCGVNKALYESYTTVTAIGAYGENTYTASAFGTNGGNFVNGYVSFRKERRFIVEYAGSSTIRTSAPIPGLQVSDKIYAYWGCARTATDCKDKFNNYDRFGGFEKIPSRNAWETGSV